MYRVNYRKYHGVVFGNQKLYQQGSFITDIPFKKGDTVFHEPVCGDVEIHQVVYTSKLS